MPAGVVQVLGHPARDGAAQAWRCASEKAVAQVWRRAFVPAIPKRRTPAERVRLVLRVQVWRDTAPGSRGMRVSNHSLQAANRARLDDTAARAFLFPEGIGVPLSRLAECSLAYAARVPNGKRHGPPGVGCSPRPRLSHVLTDSSRNTLFLRLRLRPILFPSSPLARATRSLAPV